MFSHSYIDHMNPPKVVGATVYLSWVPTANAPAGLWWQVYVNQQLVDWTKNTSIYVPIPRGPLHVDIGSVLNGEEEVSFASSLPTPPQRRVTINWQGGTSLGPDIAGYHVYGSTAGGAVNYATPLATITAYPVGLLTTGFGVGPFGMNAFGSPNLDSHSWTSQPLSAGTYTFAVAPFDSAGNEGTATLTTASVQSPPREPALFSDGITRLKYTVLDYGSGGFGLGGYGGSGPGGAQVQLNWLPSPG
jgi:hypothetical protein